MRSQRQVVDYSLQKRALLREVQAGRIGTYEVCDASVYLKNAARFHGEPTDVRCPVCRREHLTLVHYIYGDELKQSAGQARTRAELPVLAMTLREFTVYVVEVCRGCGWNHLVEQYLLGRDGIAEAERAQPQATGTGGVELAATGAVRVGSTPGPRSTAPAANRAPVPLEREQQRSGAATRRRREARR